MSHYNLADLPAEVRARVRVNPLTGCWEWQFLKPSYKGKPDHLRYGTVNLDGQPEMVHRLAYRLLVGPIPEGHEVDHVYARGCRSRACLWPVHLEPVTKRGNHQRGNAANLGRGIGRTVKLRIVYGDLKPGDEALAEAIWMLPWELCRPA